MLTFLIKAFFGIVPIQWLPPLRAVIATPPGEPTLYRDLSPKELRERHAESFTNRLKSQAQRANFVGNYIARKREEASRKKHYLLIGELCVKFSNLEQMIKELLRRFDDDEKNDTKSGEPLIKAFKKALTGSQIDRKPD